MNKKVIRPVHERSGIIVGARKLTKKANGEEVYSESYDESSFLSGSYQGRRPLWSKGNQRFMLKDLDGERLNELVKQLRWRDDEGDLITEADCRNMYDPFFNHKNLSLMLRAGHYNPEAQLHPALEQILIAGIEARYDSTSFEEMEKTGGAFTQEQKIQVEDEETKAKTENKKNNRKVELSKAYAAVVSTQKKALQVSKLLNLNHSDDIEMYNLENLIMHEIVENGQSKARHFDSSKQEAMLTIAKCNDEEIHVMSMLKDGVDAKKIELRSDGWFMGNPPERILDPERDFYKLTQVLLQDRSILERLDAYINDIG